jgi:viroplasmin and RNaseH domain-containing protein
MVVETKRSSTGEVGGSLEGVEDRSASCTNPSDDSNNSGRNASGKRISNVKAEETPLEETQCPELSETDEFNHPRSMGHGNAQDKTGSRRTQVTSRRKAKKFFAVAVGIKPGVYSSWNDAKRQVNGYPKAIHKSFKRQEAARRFVDEYQDPNVTLGSASRPEPSEDDDRANSPTKGKYKTTDAADGRSNTGKPKRRTEKYYAVAVGVKPGVYTSWTSAQRQIKGHSNAMVKSFKEKAGAERYVEENRKPDYDKDHGCDKCCLPGPESNINGGTSLHDCPPIPSPRELKTSNKNETSPGEGVHKVQEALAAVTLEAIQIPGR